MKRCDWGNVSEAMIVYHDKEWGVPKYSDRRLFEMLILGGAQAGLSWSSILNRHEGYKNAFAQFDPAKVARYTPKKIERLLQNPDIIRNRRKVEAAVVNSKAIVEIQREFGSFSKYIWQFVGGKPIQNQWRAQREIPTESAESREMSKALKKRGFSFVGPTICYAFMQSVGMVNDHEISCFRYKEINGMRR